MNKTAPLIVVADTHGHLKQVEALVSYFKKKGYLQDHRLAFLGDYVDRGPKISDLIDYLIDLKKEGHIMIAGNHEFVLRRTLAKPSDSQWADLWLLKYEEKTLQSYGLKRPRPFNKVDGLKLAADLMTAIPAPHRKFLASLPLIYVDRDLILVHAGLKPGCPWRKQIKDLIEPKDRTHFPQVFSRELATSIIHPAPQKVVSGHVPLRHPIILPKRVLLNCGIDIGGPLVAWVSDTEKLLGVY